MKRVCIFPCKYINTIPGQIITADQQQVLHHGQKMVLSLRILHCIDQNFKHFPHIPEAKLRQNKQDMKL